MTEATGARPICDICGAPGTEGPTGTVYCADHPPGAVLGPAEWAALPEGVRARREAANLAFLGGVPLDRTYLPTAEGIPVPVSAAVVVHAPDCSGAPCTCGGGRRIPLTRGETEA